MNPITAKIYCGTWWQCLSHGEQIALVLGSATLVVALVAIFVFRPKGKKQ